MALRMTPPAIDEVTTALDLSHLPPIHLIPNLLSDSKQLTETREKLYASGAQLLDDPQKATLFLINTDKKKRCQLELRSLKIWTIERNYYHDSAATAPPPAKKPRIDSGIAASLRSPLFAIRVEPNHVLMLNLHWLQHSFAKSQYAPIDEYIVFHGERTTQEISRAATFAAIEHEIDTLPVDSIYPTPSIPKINPNTSAILSRATKDTAVSFSASASATNLLSAPHGSRRFRDQTQASTSHWPAPSSIVRKPKLKKQQQQPLSQQETYPEYPPLPPPPDWLTQGHIYACQRRTLPNGPNEQLIAQLRIIRQGRVLIGDEIGVRAYSTAIASLAAITTEICNAQEILRLPGCDTKIVDLWTEYVRSPDNSTAAAREVQTQQDLRTMQLFYDIWGVGAKTAKEFVNKGWKTLDHVKEYGWVYLSHQQQIGVKYYHELKLGIPRGEVEFIREKVREHAVKVRDDGIEILLVGGYRRGKQISGDVDIMISHRDFKQTLGLARDIVASLEKEEWVTHTLRLQETNTKRGQAPLMLKVVQPSTRRGFDTLDIAMLVWQDPRSDTPKNENPHRRVDIIVSPWRTVGCAVLAWSSDITFQRDIRRYAKRVLEWKFDSSGVRSRRTGAIQKLEGPNGVGGDMIDAEKAIFKGLGLEYREPWERCTG